MAKNKDQLYDKRIIERNIEKGLATEAEYKSHLEALADQSNNADWSKPESPQNNLSD